MKVLKVAVSIAASVAVVALLAVRYDISAVLTDIRRLPPATVAMAVAALLANALFAVLRFKIVATDVERPVRFREAMAAVSAGSLAGAMFFQVAGQLIARGIVASRGGMSFASVVAITAYERIVAAIVSAIFAVAGAYFLFGKIYLDQNSGGGTLIKIVCGLIAAAAVGALLGYGRIAARSITPALARHFVRTCLRVGIATLFVQLAMMAAYIVLSQALSPQTKVPELIAASAIVMFAASVPISLAGWGIREMSAILALGAIGVEGHTAFATALLVGVGSLAAMGLIAALSLPFATKTMRDTDVAPKAAAAIDYSKAFAWALPLAAATFVLFQIYVPVGSGLLNVNLADLIAIVGGTLFALGAIRQKQLPQWRVPHTNLAIALATLALLVSLFVGVSRFGWTDWAWLNRFIGWFVLLAYGATGALIVRNGQDDGFRILALTFAGATAAVASLEICLVALSGFGIEFSRQVIVPNAAEAFSQNHNFFAFQLLMATAAIVVFVRGTHLRSALLAINLAAFWYAGSRSGWISVGLLLATGIYLGVFTRRELLIAAVYGAGIALIPVAIAIVIEAVIPNLSTVGAYPIPVIVPSQASTQERLGTIIGGLALFLDHPFFGAGLGAFRNQMNTDPTRIPLVIHSTAVWLLAELGLIGFLIFAAPAVHVFRTEWRRARADSAAALIVLCFVAFAAMATPADMLYQRTFWLLIGAAFAVASAARSEAPRPEHVNAEQAGARAFPARSPQKELEPAGG